MSEITEVTSNSEKVNEPEIMGNDQINIIDYNNNLISFYCFLIALSALVIGFEIGTADALINSEEFEDNYGSIAANLLGFIQSCFSLGSALGCVIGFFITKINCRAVMSVGYFVYQIGIIINIINNNSSLAAFITGRILYGVGGAILSIISPVYITRLTLDPAKRGLNLSFYQFLLCCGILIGNLLSIFYNPFTVQIILNCSTMVVVFFSLLYLPHTIDIETDDSKKLRFFKVPPRSLDVVELPKSGSFHWKKLLMGISLMVFQQMTGINYFFYSAKEILPQGGLAMMPSIMNLLGSILSCFIISRFKRLTILSSGSLLIMGLLITYLIVDHFLLVYIIILIFAITWGPISGILVSELANLNLAILASSVLANNGANFIILNLIPILNDVMGSNFLIIFIISTGLLTGFYFIIPETLNLTSLQIEQIFN